MLHDGQQSDTKLIKICICVDLWTGMCILLVCEQTETCSGQKMLCDLEQEVKGLLLTGILVLEIPGTRDVLLSLTFGFSISPSRFIIEGFKTVLSGLFLDQ